MIRTASTVSVAAAFAVAVLLAAMTRAAALPTEQVARAGRRPLPPATLSCERNQLTSWQGEVRDYRRTESSTRLTIDTDSETVEELSLDFGTKEALRPLFLIQGRPFTDDDWSRIEPSPGQLKEGMRAIVWVCLDEQTRPIIDWRPDEVGRSIQGFLIAS